MNCFRLLIGHNRNSVKHRVPAPKTGRIFRKSAQLLDFLQNVSFEKYNNYTKLKPRQSPTIARFLTFWLRKLTQISPFLLLGKRCLTINIYALKTGRFLNTFQRCQMSTQSCNIQEKYTQTYFQKELHVYFQLFQDNVQ